MEDFNKTNDILDFGVPEEKHSIIKVIGVGGGGGNAVTASLRSSALVAVVVMLSIICIKKVSTT